MKIKNDKFFYILVIVGYTLFAVAGYWTLLSGMNHMKWDIWDAEYPAQVLMTDAIAEGTLPLWNPLMLMGVPYYAIVGMPVWYPFTLLLAAIGYTPQTVSVEYVMHIVFGALGAFLLVKSHLDEEGKDRLNLWVSFLAGAVYCSSGLFLSNAQHIMIIISAAWVPYVLYFSKRYIKEKKIYLAMLAGLCAGLIMLGGYPEMFYDLFLILVPYILYFSWDRGKGPIANVVHAAGKYLLICIFTILASAISLLPFMQVMPYITRSADSKQIIDTTPFYSLLSMVFSRSGKFFGNSVEISMCNFYTSILAILSMPYIFMKKNRRKLIHGGLILFALIMCWGENSPLYMLFHKVLPMYAAFRFPTVFRAFLSLFLILLLAEGWKAMMKGDIRNFVLWIGLVIFIIGTAGWIICAGAMQGVVSIPMLEDEALQYLCWGMRTAAVVSGVYLLLFYSIKARPISKQKIRIGLSAVTLIELLIFIYGEIPLTIAQYTVSDAAFHDGVKAQVQRTYQENQERKRSLDLAGQPRTSSALHSDRIVFEKTFDDAGYLSIKLKAVENYKQTYNHSIIEANPEVYFTNDVISGEDMDYSLWVNTPSVSPMQIFIEKPSVSIPRNKSTIQVEPKLAKEIKTDIDLQGDTIQLKGQFIPNRKKARLAKIYIDGEQKTYPAQISFTDKNAVFSEYQGDYSVKQDDGGNYIELFFPQTDIEYRSIKVQVSGTSINNGQVFYTKRRTKGQQTEVNHFGLNSLDVNVSAPTDGYLTVLQSFYPGWHAYVDGIEVEIEKVNGCFLGVALQKGEHNIVLEFQPVDFYIGAGISIGYLTVLCMALIFRRKERVKASL